MTLTREIAEIRDRLQETINKAAPDELWTVFFREGGYTVIRNRHDVGCPARLAEVSSGMHQVIVPGDGDVEEDVYETRDPRSSLLE